MCHLLQKFPEYVDTAINISSKPSVVDLTLRQHLIQTKYHSKNCRSYALFPRM